MKNVKSVYGLVLFLDKKEYPMWQVFEKNEKDQILLLPVL